MIINNYSVKAWFFTSTLETFVYLLIVFLSVEDEYF